ncbi:hypothetical protein Tco_0240857 [Tanacetum coccineum]
MVHVSSTDFGGDILLMDIRTSKHSYGKLNSGNWVKLSDPKQALRGRHPMLILMSRIFDASRAAVFVLRSQELPTILASFGESRYPNLSD